MSYEIEHTPSGDTAETDTLEAALFAAETLLDDNDRQGSCTIRSVVPSRTFQEKRIEALVSATAEGGIKGWGF